MYGLGLEHRESPDVYDANESSPKVNIASNEVPAGGWEQRNAILEQLLVTASDLTDDILRLLNWSNLL